MSRIPILVLANKQDLPYAEPVAKVAEMLNLSKLTSNRWHIQACCASTGDGLLEGFQAFSKLLREHKKGSPY